MRERTESARDVRMIGTRAPSTRPAVSALAINARFLASIFPASSSGTTRICARPATSDLMPLILAASGSIALSKARGPSRIPPVICPRSAILQSAAASMVEGIFEVTVSTAERIATRGAQAGLARGHLAHELVRVQAALHQELAFGLVDQLDRFCRRGVAVGHVDDLEAVDIETMLAGDAGNLGGRSHEDRFDDARFRRLDGAA